MDIQDLAVVYRAKTDEELVRLADQTSQLTLEAQHILRIELATRRLTPAVQGNILSVKPVDSVDRSSFGREVSLPTGDFVQKVLRFYHSHFRLFVKLVFPAVAIGTLAIIAARHEARELFRTVPRGSLHYGAGFWAVVFVNSSGWTASWIAFSVSFAAICTAVESITAGFEGSVMDSFHGVGARFGMLLQVAILLLVSFCALEVVFELLIFGALVPLSKSVSGRASSLAIYGLTFIAFSVGSWIISRFGLAIPAVVLDDVGARQGLIRSYTLTRGKSLILAILLAKSIVGGYVAGMLPFWLAGLIPAGISLPSWFPWLLTFASVAAVAFVEPVMFIGLALLYLKTSEPASA